jgi:hypothetical protein
MVYYSAGGHLMFDVRALESSTPEKAVPTAESVFERGLLPWPKR